MIVHEAPYFEVQIGERFWYDALPEPTYPHVNRLTWVVKQADGSIQVASNGVAARSEPLRISLERLVTYDRTIRKVRQGLTSYGRLHKGQSYLATKVPAVDSVFVAKQERAFHYHAFHSDTGAMLLRVKGMSQEPTHPGMPVLALPSFSRLCPDCGGIGWVIFSGDRDWRRTPEIQRCDNCGVFASDDEAVTSALACGVPVSPAHPHFILPPWVEDVPQMKRVTLRVDMPVDVRQETIEAALLAAAHGVTAVQFLISVFEPTAPPAAPPPRTRSIDLTAPE